MKQVLMGSVVLLGLSVVPAAASTFNFTVSNAFGTGSFGTVTTTDLGPQAGSTDTVQVTIDMTPNYIVETGNLNSHVAVAFSLAGGSIDQASLGTLNPSQPAGTWTALSHQTATTSSGWVNQPFSFFNDAISGNCGNGASTGGCGSTLSFDIVNFAGFLAATNTFNGQSIYASVDIYDLVSKSTGAVGLTIAPTPTLFSATPLPGAIALFGPVLGLAFLGMRKRRRSCGGASA
jgi:hypothetical protein